MPAPPAPLLDDLHWLMACAARGLGAAIEAALEADSGLSARAYVAMLVAEESLQSQLSIARAAAIDKSTLVVVLDDLEKRGLVARKPDPADRRARLIEVTPEGRKKLSDARRSVARAERDLLAGLDAGDRDALRRLALHLGTGPAAGTYDNRAAV